MKNKNIILSAFAFAVAISLHAQTLKDAIHLTDNEQYEAAGAAFRSLVAAEPSNGTYYYYYGENYLLSDNPDSAILMYGKGSSADPANALNAIGKVKHMLNKETKANMAEASAMIDAALAKAGTKNTMAFIEAADALIKFKNDDLDKAKLLLDKAAALEPKNPEIQILYGDIYSKSNNGTLAAEYYNKAIELDKNSVKAIVSKGRLYKRSTNLDGAAEQFQNAIKIDPFFAPAHRELGEVYFKQGKLNLAKEEYKQYLELSKNNCGARIRYASFLYLGKDYPAALNEINQLKQNCDPENLTLLRVSAYSFYETKDSAKALVAINKLFSKLSEDKITATDYEYYGKVQSQNNQDSLGVINLRKAYDKDKSRCDLLNDIYKIYDKMKKNLEAVAVLREKIQYCKGTVGDYFYLGRSYLYAHDFQNADSAFMKVNELAPTYASGFLNRAKANTYIDSTNEKGLAKPFYEKYIELTAADSSGKYDKKTLIEPYRYMTAFYVRTETKDYEKATEFLRKILAIDPEDKDAIKWLKLLEEEKQKKKPQK